MSEIQKRKKGQILSNNERQLILNLMHYLKEKNSGRSVSEVIREISKATGCSERTIYKIRKEASKGIIVAPNKTRLRKKENKNSRNVKYDSYVKSLIRKKIHNYFLQNIAPTLNAILCLVNDDPELPNFKRSTLHTLLKEIGFVYEQKGKKLLLTEKWDLVKCRQEYLRDMRRFRSENKWIIYTGETVLSLMGKEVRKDNIQDAVQNEEIIHPLVVNNAINCDTILMSGANVVTGTTLLYTINNITSNFADGLLDLNGVLKSSVQDTDNIPVHTILTDNAYLFGETSNVREEEPATKGCQMSQNKISRELRFRIMHAGNESGFLKGMEHIAVSKKNAEETENYERWFIDKIMPKIPANSVIVIDNNAPYHKRKEENIPDGTWKKHQIKNWLTSKNVAVNDLNQKKDLLSLVNDLRSMYSTRRKIEEIARERGIILMSLPPHHYELNPLNLAWAQLKCHVRSNMKSFKIKKIKQLIREGFCAVTDVNWMNYVNHVRQTEDLLRTVDELQETNGSSTGSTIKT